MLSYPLHQITWAATKTFCGGKDHIQSWRIICFNKSHGCTDIFHFKKSAWLLCVDRPPWGMPTPVWSYTTGCLLLSHKVIPSGAWLVQIKPGNTIAIVFGRIIGGHRRPMYVRRYLADNYWLGVVHKSAPGGVCVCVVQRKVSKPIERLSLYWQWSQRSQLLRSVDRVNDLSR